MLIPDLSETAEGCLLIQRSDALRKSIILLTDEKVAVIRRDAFLVLVNVSATDEGASAILNSEENLIRKCLDEILNENSTLADPCAMFLSNVTRPIGNVEHVLEVLLTVEHSIDRLLTSFTRKDYNQKGMKLDYIGMTSNTG